MEIGKRKDNTGKRFGQLVVISFRDFRGSHTLWNCVCDCGNKIIAIGNNLNRGHTKSCGCFAKEVVGNNFRTHGMRHTRFWTIWNGMKCRCERPYYPNYYLYGKRGIKCLWKSFEEFKQDMYDSYVEHCKVFGEKDTTIERNDVNGNYFLENCTWATRKEQQGNKRNSKWRIEVEYLGETKTLKEWSDILNIPLDRLYQRVIKRKWTVERAFNQPFLTK